MYSKFFTIKTKIISKLNLLTSYLPFQVKAKILLPTLMVAAIAVPAGAIALSHVFQANPSGAIDGTEEVQNIPHATSAMPSPFVDQNFYDCVEAEFKKEFPSEAIDPSGLTDAQLAKIEALTCSGYQKTDVEKIADIAGIETMTALTSLDLNNNKITSIDLSQNTVLGEVKLDDILVKTDITGVHTGAIINFDLSSLHFLGTKNTIPNTPNYIFDSGTKLLTVNDLASANGYAQVVANSGADTYSTYKLQLPKAYKLHYDANEGTGVIADSKCESMDGRCLVDITSSTPTREGYIFLGWSTDKAATVAQYHFGDSIMLSDTKPEQTLYAVWYKHGSDPSREATYTLTYDANGGAGIPDPQTFKSASGEATFEISKVVPMNPGHYFLGWAKNNVTTIPEYHPGETFTTSNVQTVLYAVWQDAASGPVAMPTGALSWKHGRDHVKGSKDDAVFNVDYPAADFKFLKLNNKTLERDKDYTVMTPASMANSDNMHNTNANSSYFSVNDNPTSATITIKGAYLDTLTPNTYNIIASFAADDINTTIKIINNNSNVSTPVTNTSGTTNSPNTGEGEHQANPAIVTLCILIPLLAAALTFVSYKIFKPKRKSPLEYYTYKG